MRSEAPAKKRVLILLNPAARNGRSIVSAAREIARHKHTRLELIVPDARSRTDQIAAAHSALRDGVDAVFVAGGDGAMHGAINLIADYDVPLGLIPTGSGNDFARALGIKSMKPKLLLQRLLDAVEAGSSTRPVDAISLSLSRDGVADRTLWVANSVNIGFDAAVNRRGNALKKVPSSLRYLVALFWEVPRFLPLRFTIASDENGTKTHNFTFVCVHNGPFIGGGIPLAPRANITDGYIEVSTVDAIARPWLVVLFPFLFLRLHDWLTPLKTHRAKRATVTVPEGVPVFADGEEVIAATRGEMQLDCEVRSGAIRMLQVRGSNSAR